MPKTLIGGNYYGSISADAMKILNRKIENTYWRDALESSESPVKAKKDWFTKDERATFMPYLELREDAVVLDIGAGCGAISAALSKKVRKVVAVEKGSENIYFLKKRFEQDKLSNIKVIKAEALDLPFRSDTFDAVILNGVLEWIPNFDITIRPDILQLECLKKIFHVIKPGGKLYIGTENRTYIKYFFGYPDPHCGLPWVTVLPRYLASAYSVFKTGKPYINYIYSRKGHTNLLHKAGFSDIKTYWVLDNYNFISEIVPIEDKTLRYYFNNFYLTKFGTLKRNIKNAVKNISRRLIPVKLQIGCFMIIAKKQ